MKTTVLVFHDKIETTSKVNKLFAKALADAGFEVRDLYSVYPDYAIDVAHEQAVLSGADRIVLVFPMQWYSSPALLKKYQDDVLTYGWAYGHEGKALHGKELLLVVSTGTPENLFTHEAVGYSINELLRPFQQMARYTGQKYLTPFITSGTLGITDEALAAQAEKLVAYVKNDKIAELGQLA